MTKREALRQTQQENALLALGFTRDEAESLRRISIRLQRWYEKECGIDGGCIERDETTGVPYWYRSNHSYLDPHDPRARYRIPDLERGAEKRLKAIISARNQRAIAATPEPATLQGNLDNAIDQSVTAYLQTDPRGAALYILRPGDVPEGKDASSYYTRGICVY